jgi:hypothetical protein
MVRERGKERKWERGRSLKGCFGLREGERERDRNMVI